MDMNGYGELVHAINEIIRNGKGRMFFREPVFVGNGIDGGVWEEVFSVIGERIGGELEEYRVGRSFVGGGLELVARYRMGNGSEKRIKLMVLDKAYRKYVVGVEVF